jgi:hypothetical protein
MRLPEKVVRDPLGLRTSVRRLEARRAFTLSRAMLLFHRFACEPKSVSATGGVLSDNHPYYRSWEHNRFTNSSAPLLRIFRQGLRPKKTHASIARSEKITGKAG